MTGLPLRRHLSFVSEDSPYQSMVWMLMHINSYLNEIRILNLYFVPQIATTITWLGRRPMAHTASSPRGSRRPFRYFVICDVAAGQYFNEDKMGQQTFFENGKNIKRDLGVCGR